MKVFILAGLQLSGKSSHGHRMENEKGWPMIETGHAVYFELQAQGLETNHINTTKVIKKLLSRDPNAFAKTILEYEQKKYEKAPVLLFNGIKSPAEIEFVRERFGIENVNVIGFHASQKTRFSRVTNPDRFTVSGEFQQKKQEDQDLAKWENFISRDIREIGLGIGIALALCSEIIVTENKLWPHHDFEKSYEIFENIVTSRL